MHSFLFLRKLSFRNWISPAHTWLFGLLVAGIGLVVLAAWAMQIKAIASIHPDWPAMVPATALCFLLTGSALALSPFYGRLPWIAPMLGALVLCISGLFAFELVFGASWDDFRRVRQLGGPIAPTTVFAFMLVGALLVSTNHRKGLIATSFVQVATALVGSAGFLGLLGYFINLEFLYVRPDLRRMAILTACGFIILSYGIWCTWKEASWNIKPNEDIDGHHIIRTSDVLLCVIVAIVALVAFALSQDRSEKLMADAMSELVKDRRTYFKTLLDVKRESAAMVANRPVLLSFIRAHHADPQDAALKKLLTTASEPLLMHGFSALRFENTEGKTIISIGKSVEQPAQVIDLAGKPVTSLLWKDGYILRTRLPLQDADGIVAYVLVEQALPEITQLQQDAMQKGASGDMVICGLRNTWQVCFPFRSNPKPESFFGYLDGKPLPLTRAALGETATTITPDFRRQRVMAAFGPIGDTGLGMALKMDMWELYAPVRTQFFLALPFFALLVIGSVVLMRIRLRPLLATIDNSRRELAFLAQHDVLTKLPNRLLFNDRLDQAMLRARRTNKLMAVMYLDIDHFKDINDTYGHRFGDEVLIWFSMHLRAEMRASDTVSRVGGDEFTIILEVLGSEEDALRIALKLRDAVSVSTPPLPDKRIPQITCSIGMAFYRGGAVRPDELLAKADSALYASKQKNRNTYSVA